MAAATITEKYVDNAMSRLEIVRLTATDGETYTSQKFKEIFGAWVFANSDVDAYINATWSGRVVTINWNGQTDKVCSLLIFGKK